MKLDFDDWTKQVTDTLNDLKEFVIILHKKVKELENEIKELKNKEKRA